MKKRKWWEMRSTWGMFEESMNAPRKTHERGRMHRAHEVISDNIERQQEMRRAAGHHTPEPLPDECNWRVLARGKPPE
jgi:hypothetical protein